MALLRAVVSRWTMIAVLAVVVGASCAPLARPSPSPSPFPTSVANGPGWRLVGEKLGYVYDDTDSLFIAFGEEEARRYTRMEDLPTIDYGEAVLVIATIVGGYDCPGVAGSFTIDHERREIRAALRTVSTDPRGYCRMDVNAWHSFFEVDRDALPPVPFRVGRRLVDAVPPVA